MKNVQNKIIGIFQDYIGQSKILNKKTISVYMYGSAVTGEMNSQSDIDCIVIAKNIDFVYLKKINELVNFSKDKLNIEVFINVKVIDDFNKDIIENDMFGHRERPNLFLFDLINHFELVYGSDIRKELVFPTNYKKRLRQECVRLLRNLRYMNYKLLGNVGTKLYTEETLMKNILLAAKMFEIFSSYSYYDYARSVKLASKVTNLETAELAYRFLKKGKKSQEIKRTIKEQSIKYYDLLIELVDDDMKQFKTRKGCIRQSGFIAYYEISEKTLRTNKEVPVIMFLNGLPRPSKVDDVSTYFTKQGYVFVNVYYPGYWEGGSTMEFSKLSEGVRDLARMFKAGNVQDVFTGNNLSFDVGDITLIGSSFGATIALGEGDNIFKKTIVISPLIDFSAHLKVVDDLFNKLSFFNSAIRFSKDNEELRADFELIDPSLNEVPFDNDNILIITDKHDKQIQFDRVDRYAKDNEIKLYSCDYAEHGYRLFYRNDVMEEIINFIK